MTLTPLAPVRHNQEDFFIADIFDNLPWKDDMASMEHPLFTLSLKPDMRILRYENNGASIEMQPSAFGLPNIMDKDLLLYCASVVMAKINAGEIPPKTIRLSMRDVLIATNRHTGTAGYNYIKTALKRLTGCMLETSIKTGRTKQGKMFHLLESSQYLESARDKKRVIGVEVTLSDWFYNSLIAKEVLSINKNYFRLRKPLDRRIYEIARKHCGIKKLWQISLEKLHLKTGSTSPLKRFRHNVKKLSETQHLPDYAIHLESEKDLVIFGFTGEIPLAMTFDQDPDALPQTLPPEILDDLYHAVGEGLNYYDLWYQFINWQGSRTAKNWRGAFIGFCQRKAGNSVKTEY